MNITRKSHKWSQLEASSEISTTGLCVRQDFMVPCHIHLGYHISRKSNALTCSVDIFWYSCPWAFSLYSRFILRSPYRFLCGSWDDGDMTFILQSLSPLSHHLNTFFYPPDNPKFVTGLQTYWWEILNTYIDLYLCEVIIADRFCLSDFRHPYNQPVR